MHRSFHAAFAALLCLILILIASAVPTARGGEPATIVEARNRLAQGDARGAVKILEATLPRASAETRPALLEALRDAYTAAARQAEHEGKTAEADSFRDDLEILGPGNRIATAPTRPVPPAPTDTKPPSELASTPEPANASAPRSASADPVEPLTPLPPIANPVDAPPVLAAPEAIATEPARPDPAVQPASVRPESNPVAADEPAPLPAPAPVAAPPAVAAPAPPAIAARTPVKPVSTPTEVEGPSLAAAVEAFKAANYDAAGKIFAELDHEGKLPAAFKGHWAYCRAGEVVRRINARPSTPQEWGAIDAEIQAIRDLSPSNWFAEYLRNLASERNRDAKNRPAARSNKVTVRGSSPDEPPAARGPGAMIPANASPAPQPSPAPTPMPMTPIAWSRQPVESANFVVIHVEKDRALAERAVREAEATREAQVKRWGAGSEAWTPRCEIILFPTARDFARETLQPPDSPGVSTMGMTGGKIVLRRVNLRTDHPAMVSAILPHEVTHVVLADLFPEQQIPRWADEGMAVLAEPRSEQATRAADLDEPLRSGRVFRAGDLMSMTQYPKPEFWSLYYAQSVSLTRFLVETGSPAQFIRFVQQSQQTGIEPALKQVYSISSFAELQSRWLSFARQTSANSADLTASSAEPRANPPTRRQ